MIRYYVSEGAVELLFHINETGNLVIDADGREIEIDHLTSIELIEMLRVKLYDHQANKESLLKRIFR
jgi:hypothetical protein